VKNTGTNVKVFRKLTYNFCFHGPRFKTREEFAADGLELTWAAWFRLQSAVTHSGRRISKNIVGQKKTLRIEEFFAKIKKGSRQFHQIIRKHYCNDRRIVTDTTVTTYCKLTKTIAINDEDRTGEQNAVPIPVRIQENKIECKIIKHGLSLWNIFFLPNDLREFLFKSRNNSLWTNGRLFAAGLREDPYCTFCKIRQGTTVKKKSFLHLFLECQTTHGIVTEILEVLRENVRIDTPFLNNYFRFGLFKLPDSTVRFDWTRLLLWEIVRYCIWKKRCSRRVPNTGAIKKEVIFILANLSKISKKWDNRIRGSDFLADLVPVQR